MFFEQWRIVIVGKLLWIDVSWMFFFCVQVVAPWHLCSSRLSSAPWLGSCLRLRGVRLSPVFLLLEHVGAFPPSVLLWFRREEAFRLSTIHSTHCSLDRSSSLSPCSLQWAWKPKHLWRNVVKTAFLSVAVGDFMSFARVTRGTNSGKAESVLIIDFPVIIKLSASLEWWTCRPFFFPL